MVKAGTNRNGLKGEEKAPPKRKGKPVVESESESESDSDVSSMGEDSGEEEYFSEEHSESRSSESYGSSDEDEDSGMESEGDSEDESEIDSDEVDGLAEAVQKAYGRPSRPPGGAQTGFLGEYVAESDGAVASMRGRRARLDLGTMVQSLGEAHGQVAQGVAALGDEAARRLVVGEAATEPQRQRMEREQGYEQVQKTLSEWWRPVRAFREAPHVQFPLNAPKYTKTALEDLVEDPATLQAHKARTDAAQAQRDRLSTALEPAPDGVGSMTSRISDLLRATGAPALEVEAFEEDVLGARRLTERDVRERQKALRRMRNVLFAEELKAKRLKKIKSKKFRKILKREREKHKLSVEELREVDPERAREEEEKRERARLEERMLQRHRNRGRWAQHLLRRGGQRALDADSRAALAEQIRLGEQLREKQDSMGGAASDDEEADEEALRQLEADVAAADPRGIHALPFMRKAEARRAAANAEARLELDALDRELPPADALSEDEDENAVEGLLSEKTLRRKEREAALEQLPVRHDLLNKLRASHVQVDSSDLPKSPVSAAMAEDAREVSPRKLPKKAKKDSSSLLENVEQVEKGANALAEDSPVEMEDVRGKTHTNREKEMHGVRDEENPWLVAPQKRASRAGGPAESVLESAARLEADVAAAKPARVKEGRDFNLGLSEQKELIRQAFARDDLMEAEFEREKAALVEAEVPDELKQLERGVPGWGSWTGEGVVAPKRKVHERVRSQLNEKRQRALARRKDKNLRRVILHERDTPARYLPEYVPRPFENEDQYRAAMRHPLGPDWNTVRVFRQVIRPRIQTLPGLVIDPVRSKKHLQKNISKH